MNNVPRTFADLFVRQLRRMHGVELESLALLPHLAEAASSKELRHVFDSHLKETRRHVERLEEIFRLVGAVPGGEHCVVMDGLAAECREVLRTDESPALRDASLIAAAQCIEHHEIAEYGTCRTYAQELGLHQAADLLQSTLEEESAADERLTLVAEGSLFHTGVNALAHEDAAAA